MSGASSFDAGAVVEELEWDFTKYGGEKGIIPEPTDDEFQRFMKKVQKLAKDSGLAGVAAAMQSGNPAQAAAVMAQMDEDLVVKAMAQMPDIVGEFTNNCPSADQIRLLPMRVQQKFFEWLMGQFRPEGSAAGLTPGQAATKNGVTASTPVTT